MSRKSYRYMSCKSYRYMARKSYRYMARKSYRYMARKSYRYMKRKSYRYMARKSYRYMERKSYRKLRTLAIAQFILGDWSNMLNVWFAGGEYTYASKENVTFAFSVTKIGLYFVKWSYIRACKSKIANLNSWLGNVGIRLAMKGKYKVC